MANAFYNRGASFNPDELADGDAIEAEFDSVSRGFDTIEDLVNLNKAGYPSQTFHVAPATEATHAVQKAQLDASVASLNNSISATNIDLDQLQIEVGTKLAAASYSASDVLAKLKTVDGGGSGLDADNLDGYGGERYSRSAIATFGSGDWNSMNSHGTYKISHADFLSDTNPPPAVYPYGVLVVDVAEIGGEARVLQVYYPHGTTDKYIYQRMRNNGVWDAWCSIWRGGTGYGSGLVAAKVDGVAPTGDGRDLVWGQMGGDDFFRLRVYSNAYDGGAVEIATADGGNEPIYVRQYTGGFTSAVRTLELLNGNGDTVLPGRLYAYSGAEVAGNGQGLFQGNGDNCASTINNLKLASWNGIGFGPSITGQPVPYGEYSHWFNARNGDAGMRGSLSIWGNIQCNGVLSSGSWLSSVAVLTGEIGHGGTLPIPSGFSEGQCKFFVSPRDTNSSGYNWDLREGISAEHYRIICYQSGRVALGYTLIYNDVNDSYESRGFTMSYIVIGVK